VLKPLAVVSVAVLAASTAACGGEQGNTGEPAAAGQKGGGAEVPRGVANQQSTMEEEIDAEGGEKRAGPLRIAYIVEPAEGWFERRNGELEWRPPARSETHHIEILPIEASTGRLVPQVPITLEVTDLNDEIVDRRRVSPYYGEFFHYANNFAVPQAGRYKLRATIEPPDLRRHGEKEHGPALAEGATVEFESVSLERE
jgi:Fe2+ transport protein